MHGVNVERRRSRDYENTKATGGGQTQQGTSKGYHWGRGIDNDMELAEVGEEEVINKASRWTLFPITLPCVHRTRCPLVPLQQRPEVN